MFINLENYMKETKKIESLKLHFKFESLEVKEKAIKQSKNYNSLTQYINECIKKELGIKKVTEYVKRNNK